jgi:chemotaxis protein CheD
MDILQKIIHQEQLYVAKGAAEIHTILGSCVAVCLYDERFKIAGMNHYLLPLWNGEGLKTLKYGNISIDRLIEEMLKNGAIKKYIIAKIFGGASINLDQSFSVGIKNVTIAKTVLQDNKIPIVAEDTGGNKGRKVIFNSLDGSVYVKYSS